MPSDKESCIIINIYDEYNFMPSDKESCCRKLLEGNRKKCVEKGREVEIRLLNINESTYQLGMNI